MRVAVLGGAPDLPLHIDRAAARELDTLCAGCLLYTSDAADERSSVDLGGRRIIKKKRPKSCAVLIVHDTLTISKHSNK